MSHVITYSDRKPSGTFAQIKLDDGKRILVSFTQTEIAIFKLASGGMIPTGSIFKHDIKVKSISDEKLSQFLFEILYLFLHVADRTAFNKLNEEQRNIFIDRLQENVVKEICKNGTEAECKSFPAELNDRHRHYSQYKKLMTKTDEGTKDSLAANFSYQMSKLLIGKDELLISLPLQIAVSNYIIGFKLPELLENRS